MKYLLEGLIHRNARRDNGDNKNKAEVEAAGAWLALLMTEPHFYRAINAWPVVIDRILRTCEVCITEPLANIALAILGCVNYSDLAGVFGQRNMLAIKDNGLKLGELILYQHVEDIIKSIQALKIDEDDDGDDEEDQDDDEVEESDDQSDEGESEEERPNKRARFE